MEIPNPVVECDSPDCTEELNLLNAHVSIALKIKRGVLVTETVPVDGSAIPEMNLYLGSQSGRGVLRRFHDFKCLSDWVAVREDYEPRLDVHYEEEIYVPEDNRSPEELVEAGEQPKEILALHAAYAGEGS